MRIENTSIKEVKIITPQLHRDRRGCFFESYKSNFNQKNGLPSNFGQENEVQSKKGVLRGLHYQLNKPQGKFVTVLRGKIFDVAVDIRPNSPRFGQWAGVELSAENRNILLISLVLLIVFNSETYYYLPPKVDFTLKCV